MSIRRSGRPIRRSGWGQETLLEGRVGLGGPPCGLGGIGRPTQSSGRGREAHREFREVSGGPHGGPGGVQRLTRRFGRGREAHPKGREWLGGLPGDLEGVRIPTLRSRMLTQRYGWGQKATRRCSRPIRMSGMGREYYPEVREGSGVPSKGLGGIRRPTRRSGRTAWRSG